MSATAVTGHRPHKLPDEKTGHDAMNPFRVAVRRTISGYLRHTRPEKLLSGGAAGIDLDFLLCGVALGIPFEMYLPLPADRHWQSLPQVDRPLHRYLQALASKIVVCSDGYTALVGRYGPGTELGGEHGAIRSPFLVRDEYMVEQLGPEDRLLSVWDGTDGGTAYTTRYAQKTGRAVDLLDLQVLKDPQRDLFRKLEVRRL